LRWQHVDFANRILHVRRNLPSGTFQEDTPKSHRVRSVPLSDQAIVALDGLSRREHFTAPDDLIFPNEVGRHLLDDFVRGEFYDALEVAGLGSLREKDDPVVFHDLRHTFGTMCASRGIDLLKIKAWLGHAELKTTMRYLHHVPKHDDAALLTAAFAPENVPPDVPRTAEIGGQLSATAPRKRRRRAMQHHTSRSPNPQVASSSPAGGAHVCRPNRPLLVAGRAASALLSAGVSRSVSRPRRGFCASVDPLCNSSARSVVELM
jgi:hypothetical protein